MQKEMETLTADRKHLRNKERRKIDEAELAEVKSEIFQISQRLKQLRKEISLCDDIAERSQTIENNLEIIIADEEKQKSKGKEEKVNEQFR